jgi:5'-3' exonuclease
MLLLIDGDVMAHIACKDRWPWIQKERGIPHAERTFKPPEEGIIFSPAEGAKYFKESYKHFKSHLVDTCSALFTNNYLMAMKGDGNYRDDIYPEYKAQRKNKPHGNEFVQFVRELAISEELAVPAHGREADDYLRIWAKECEIAGIDYIICTIDKDLDCIPGKHWNLKKNELTVVTEDYAMRFYYEQLLMGDPTDNIPGLPNIGPVKAKLLLSDCNTHSEFQKAVINVYQTFYPEDWKGYLLSNGKMIHIQGHINDYFHLDSWGIAEEIKPKLAPVEIAEEVVKSKIGSMKLKSS